MSITGLKLRCPLAACDSMKVTAPSGGYEAGQLAAVNQAVGLVVDAADEGEEAVLIYRAPKVAVPCASGTYAAGKKVYYDSSEGEVTTTSTDNTLCGVVVVGGTTVTEIVIDLDGLLGVVA